MKLQALQFLANLDHGLENEPLSTFDCTKKTPNLAQSACKIYLAGNRGFLSTIMSSCQPLMG
jgi:hypothetical protein